MVRRTRPGISRFSDVQLHIVVRCFASPRNDARSSAFPRHDPPEFCQKFLALDDGGRRECRAPDAPAAARVLVVSTRVSHHGHTGNTRHSPRDGFNGFLRDLPGDRAFLPPSPRGSSRDDLTPASGRQDHTTSPYASRAFRLEAPKRPPHPAPNVRDDREAPLLRARDGGRCIADLGLRSNAATATHQHDGQIGWWPLLQIASEIFLRAGLDRKTGAP
jgi:hypothetical protein